MKKSLWFNGIIMVLALFILNSCGSSVTLTSWKNPAENVQIGNVVVWGMFDKLEYQKPFEQYAAAYLNKKGFKAMESLKFIAPGHKYELPVLEKKFDSLGVEGILVWTYKGTDKSESYVPRTTTVYPDFYYNYYNFYNWGYPMYGFGANVVTSGGYWTTTSTVRIQANLYANSHNGLLWTGEISITDPQYIDEAATRVISYIYSDWTKNGIIRPTAK